MECPVCTTESVVEEEENGRVHQVCVECGHIVHETSVLSTVGCGQTSDHSEVSGRYEKWNLKRRPSVPEGKRIGVRIIRIIGSLFKFRADMVEYARQLYNRVFDEKVRRYSLESKKALAVCCIYVTARENNYAVTVRDLSRFLEMKKGVHRFGCMLKLLRTEFDIRVKDVGPALEAYNFLSKINFPLSLIKVTQRLLQLMEMSCITAGKSMTLAIIAAAFTAWKCNDPVKNKSVGLKQFCKMFSITYGKQAQKRKNEIYEVLKALALQIPWVGYRNDIDDLNVEYYLKDILDFQQTLLQNAISAAVCEFREAENQKDEAKSDADTDKECAHFLPCSKRIKTEGVVSTGESSQSSSNVGSNSGSTNSPRKKDIPFSDDDDYYFDLGSEDDTDDYILKSHEVELKQWKAKFLEASEAKKQPE